MDEAKLNDNDFRKGIVYYFYTHILKKKARKLIENSEKDLYKITTIDWVYATENGKENEKKVHINEHIITGLWSVIEFVISHSDPFITESVVRIEKIDDLDYAVEYLRML